MHGTGVPLVTPFDETGAIDEAALRSLVELNHAVTVEHGIPGLKAPMRLRGAPAGHVRSPHRPVDATVEATLEALLHTADVQ